MTQSTSSTLPRDIVLLIDTVVSRTKLRGHERADIHRELSAHFCDGIAAGESADELLAKFGDARESAKELRAGAIAKRPPMDRALRQLRLAAGWGLVASIAVYGLAIAYLSTQKPVLSFDPIARFQASLPKAVAGEEAWAIYKQGLLLLADRSSWAPDGSLNPTGLVFNECGGDSSDAVCVGENCTPAFVDPDWERHCKALMERAAGLELLSLASRKATLGCRPAHTWEASDADIFTLEQFNSLSRETAFPLLNVRLPHILLLKKAGRMLAADAVLALEQKDGGRFVRNISAMIGTSMHAEEDGILVSQIVAQGIRKAASACIVIALASHPQTLTDDQLNSLAQRLREIPDSAYQLDLSTELLSLQDVMQRTFSDDGNGDGVYNPAYATALMSTLYGGPSAEQFAFTPSEQTIAVLLSPFGAAVMATRKETNALCESLFSKTEHQSTLPLWQQNFDHADEFEELVRLKSLGLEMWLIPRLLVPAHANAASIRRRAQSNTHAAQIAIAIEQFRRANAGAWPTSLDALVPTYLASVPADPYTGKPVGYAIANDHPLVWSVGEDKIDQHGIAAQRQDERAPEDWIWITRNPNATPSSTSRETNEEPA